MGKDKKSALVIKSMTLTIGSIKSISATSMTRYIGFRNYKGDTVRVAFNLNRTSSKKLVGSPGCKRSRIFN